jgi:hypothetical protein
MYMTKNCMTSTYTATAVHMAATMTRTKKFTLGYCSSLKGSRFLQEIAISDFSRRENIHHRDSCLRKIQAVFLFLMKYMILVPYSLIKTWTEGERGERSGHLANRGTKSKQIEPAVANPWPHSDWSNLPAQNARIRCGGEEENQKKE